MTAIAHGSTPRFARICGVLAALVALLVSSIAHPSGIVAPQAGGWDTPVAMTVNAMHLNPATLTLRPEGQAGTCGWQLDTAFVIADARFQRERRATYQHSDGFAFKLPLDASSVDPSKTGLAQEVHGQTRLPNIAVGGRCRIGDRLAAGLSAVPGFAAVLKLPDDGPHRWQLQETFVLVEQVKLGAAFHATNWLHIGASLDLTIGALSLRQVVDLAGTDMLGDALADPPISQANDFSSRAPPGVRELDVLSRPANLHNASAIGLGFTVGAVARLLKTVWIAASWQQGVDLTYVGDFYLDMDHPFFTSDLASQGLKYPRRVQGKAFVPFPTPSILRTAAVWRPSAAFQWHVQLAWLRYSVIQALEVTAEADGLAQPELGLGNTTRIAIDRGWSDTFEVETLLSVGLGQRWRLGARGGFHTPVSPDRTLDMLSLDGDRVIAGLTARFDATERLSINAHVLVHQVLERRVQASDFDRGNGVYSLRIVAFGLGLMQRF